MDPITGTVTLDGQDYTVTIHVPECEDGCCAGPYAQIVSGDAHFRVELDRQDFDQADPQTLLRDAVERTL